MSFRGLRSPGPFRTIGGVNFAIGLGVGITGLQTRMPCSTFRNQLPGVIDSIPGGAGRPWVLPAGRGAGSMAGTIAGLSDLSATGSGRARAAANLAGTGSLTAPLRLTIFTSATIAGAGELAGSMSSPAHLRAFIKIGADPGADEIADAVWQRQLSAHTDPEVFGGLLALLGKIARNKTVTDPASGTITVFDDDGVTPLLSADLFENVAGTQPYRGDGADRRERLE